MGSKELKLQNVVPRWPDRSDNVSSLKSTFLVRVELLSDEKPCSGEVLLGSASLPTRSLFSFSGAGS